MVSAERVFVYGTLRRGDCRDINVAYDGAVFLRAGWVGGALYDLGEYPGLRLDADTGRVVGEIYDVPPATLAELDELEGYDPARVDASEYVRKRTLVRGESGEVDECWVYEIAERSAAGRRRIAGGDWLLDLGSRG